MKTEERQTCPNCGRECEDGFCSRQCEKDYLGDVDVDYGDVYPEDQDDDE